MSQMQVKIKRHYRVIRPTAVAIVVMLGAVAGWAQQVREGGRPERTQFRGLPGVILRIYEVGQPLVALPKLVEGQQPNHVRIIDDVDLRSSEGDFAAAQAPYYSELTGLLRIPRDGTYAFRLTSDDGAQFYIGNRLIIDHDGLHAATAAEGQMRLIKNQYPFRIRHFNAGGDARLLLEWYIIGAAEGITYATVPKSVFTHEEDESVMVAPGKKQVIPALRIGRPGDGRALDTKHPAFAVEGDQPMFDPSLARWLLDGRLLPLDESIPKLAKPPVAWLPTNNGRTTYISVAGVPTGPYRGQLLVQAARGESKRLVAVPVDEQQQGVIFRLGAPGSSVKPTGEVPFEMLKVRPLRNGVEVEFTKPLDERVGWDPESYYVEFWPFDVSAAQPPQRSGERVAVKSASVSADRRKVFLEVPQFEPGRVVYLRLYPPCISEQGEKLRSTEAWLTLNALPQEVGEVRTPPAQPEQNMLSAAEQAEGWRLLFDGKSTAGWRGYLKGGFPDGWEVKNGCLVRTGPGGDLITEAEFGDFELKLEWRIAPGGNSGIFYRVEEEAGAAWHTGPEMQVLDNTAHKDAKNNMTSAGSCYALYAPRKDATEPVGLFNEVRIVCRGKQVEHWLNGTKIVSYEIGSDEWQQRVADSKFAKYPRFGRVERGHIVLQDHGDKVWYRNIKIRPLDGVETLQIQSN